MRRCPYEHVSGTRGSRRRHQKIGGDDVARVEHADTVCPVGAVEYAGPVQLLSGSLALMHEGLDCGWHAPAPRPAGVRTTRRLDAVDRAHPLGEAHVLRAVAACFRPGHARSDFERPSPNGPVRPPAPRTLE